MRNYSLDTLRSIATIFVVIIHVCAPIVTKSDFQGDLFWVSNILNSFSRVSVPIFVIISGTFLLNQNLENFYSKRLKKILIPLLFWTIFYLLYNYIPLLKANSSIDWKSILMKILIGKPYYHLWYVYMIVGLYLVTPLIKNYIEKKSNSTVKKIIIILFIAGILFQYLTYHLRLQIPFFLQLTNYLGYFLLGGYLYKHKSKIPTVLLLVSYAIFSLITAILIFYCKDLYFYEYLSIFVIGASICFFILFSEINIRQNILSDISKYSFGIYLIHSFILSRLIKLNYNFSLVETLILCLSLSIITAYLINKIKYLRKII